MSINYLLLLLAGFWSVSGIAQTIFSQHEGYAKSAQVQALHAQAVTQFSSKQQEHLSSSQGAYTDQPPASNYYEHASQGDLSQLKQAAAFANVQDEVTLDATGKPMPTPGKVIATAFVSRPVVKITSKEEFMQKGKIVTDNAKNIVTGESNKHINCSAQTMSACKIINIEKTCNEANTVHKVCEQIPEISTQTNIIVQPNCHKAVVTQADWVHCPAGYQQILYSDMIRFVSWDDIRLCRAVVSHDEPAECLAGYLVRGINGNGGTLLQSTQRMVLPKKMHGRIRFTNFFDGFMNVTIVNETTGAVLCNQESIANGRVIELPFSITQDQTFRFNDNVMNPISFGRFRGGGFFGKGVVVLYVDHLNPEKVAKVQWKDLPCHYE